MKPLNWLPPCALLAAVAAWAGIPSSMDGATFSTELALSPSHHQWGEHLTASYDFGVEFRAVHSVWIELDMPDGYQGAMISGGSSMLHRRLAMEIHAPSDPPPVDSLFEFVRNSTILIPPDAPAKFGFGRWLVSLGESVEYMDFPSFLLSGSASVSIADATTAYYHPLPDGEGSTSTTNWSLPSGIKSARLTIEATPVPEPGAVMIALFAGIALLKSARRG